MAARAFNGFAQNAEVQETLTQLASTAGPIRNDVHMGEFMDVEAVVNMTGKALAVGAGKTTVPDEPREGAFGVSVASPAVLRRAASARAPGWRRTRSPTG